MFAICQFFKRRAIRQYIKTLSPALLKSYGPRETYTDGQINAMLNASALASAMRNMLTLFLAISTQPCTKSWPMAYLRAIPSTHLIS